jgi:8-oxo-dGTP diphosphatase
MSHEHKHGGTVVVHTPKYCMLCGSGIEMRNVKKGEPDRHVCSKCNEVHWLEPKIAVGVVIEHQGGIVMLQRDIDPGRGKWVYPGGFVDRGESLEMAGRREAREEAVIELGEMELLGAFSYEGHPVILIAYVSTVKSGVPSAGDEAQACEIWEPEKIRWDDLAFRSTIDTMKAYLARRAKM